MVFGGRRTVGLGCVALLVAMAIQGLTPDYASLSSSWLLRHLSAWSTDAAIARGDPRPRPAPLRGDDAGTPVELGGAVVTKARMRAPHDEPGRPRVVFLPAILLEPTAPRVCPSVRPPDLILRGPGGLISSLCRFLC